MSPAKSKPKTSADRRVAIASIGVITCLLAGVGYWAWSDTPQLADDSDVYASLDALFTAVSSRREPLVADCQSKLTELHREGKIAGPAWKRIARILDLAEAGQWESAAQDLYSFIERQKRRT